VTFCGIVGVGWSGSLLRRHVVLRPTWVNEPVFSDIQNAL